MTKLIWRVATFLFVFGLGFFAAKSISNAAIVGFLQDFWPYIAVGSVCFVLFTVLVSWTAYWLARRFLRHKLGTGTEMPMEEMVPAFVDKAIYGEISHDAQSQDRMRTFLVNVGLWLARREALQFQFAVIVTVGGGLVGAATLFLLNEQNQKLQLQNEKLAFQTDATVVQTLLLEGSRRAALSSRFTSLLNDLEESASIEKTECEDTTSDDCWRAAQEGNIRLLVPNEELARRYTTLAAQSTPYHTSSYDRNGVDFSSSLSEQVELRFVSPERGQILQVLAQNKFYIGKANFSNADVSFADLENANLAGLYAIGADFEQANLGKADLPQSALSFANFRRTFMQQANLSNSNIEASDFTEAVLENAALHEVQAEQAKFTRVQAGNVDFRTSNLEDSDFENAFLAGARFAFGTRASRANFQGAWLEDANFSETMLDGADLSGAYISNTDFTRAIFDDDTRIDLAFAGLGTLPKGLPSGTRFLVCETIIVQMPPPAEGINCEPYVTP